MSSILKALQRLEQEKVAHQPGTLQVDREILTGERTRTRTPLLLAGGLALFVCGSGLTYYFVTQSVAHRTPAAKPADVAQPLIQPAARVSPAPSTPVECPAPPSAPVIKEAVVKKVTAPLPAKPAAVAPQPAVRAVAKKAEQPISRPEKPSAKEKAPATGGQQLQVSGIAFREGMDDNMAVVNGAALSVGAVVEGARIEQIMKDRVLFSRNGSQFTIVMGSSGP